MRENDTAILFAKYRWLHANIIAAYCLDNNDNGNEVSAEKQAKQWERENGPATHIEEEKKKIIIASCVISPFWFSIPTAIRRPMYRVWLNIY